MSNDERWILLVALFLPVVLAYLISSRLEKAEARIRRLEGEHRNRNKGNRKVDQAD